MGREWDHVPETCAIGIEEHSASRGRETSGDLCNRHRGVSNLWDGSGTMFMCTSSSRSNFLSFIYRRPRMKMIFFVRVQVGLPSLVD